MQGKYLGAIFGLAIGDALGFPVEFMSAQEIRTDYGPDGVTDFLSVGSHPPGTYSDDTQMTLALARALLRAGDRDLDTLMNTVAKEFVSWAFGPDNDRAPGNTCMSACRRLRDGADWHHSGVPDSKGCGSAMRSAPIGLYYHRDVQQIVDVGITTSQITHGHACALAGSVATAYLTSLALDGVTPNEMLTKLVGVTEAINSEFVAEVRQVPDVLSLPPEEAFDVLGEGWIAEEAVAGALYCFWRTPNDYRRTVLTAANAPGDSDSIACIAGAISGAYNGIQAIPPNWETHVENRSTLQDIARSLHKASRV